MEEDSNQIDSNDVDPNESMQSIIYADIDDENEYDQDENVVCDVCLDGNTCDNNEIVICETCSVAVHQECYNVAVVPEGAWYCDICAVGGDPAATVCELCPFMEAGAFKRTRDKDKWSCFITIYLYLFHKVFVSLILSVGLIHFVQDGYQKHNI